MGDEFNEEDQELLEGLSEEKQAQLKERFRREKANFRREKAISERVFFDPFTKFLKPKEEAYAGAYQYFCKRINNEKWEEVRPSDYGVCLGKLRGFAKDEGEEDMSLKSYSSRASETDASAGTAGRSLSERSGSNGETRTRNRLHNKGKTPKLDEMKVSILGGLGNSAHALPRASTECAPLHGILGSAILGVDLEKDESMSPNLVDRDKLVKIYQAAAIGTQGMCSSKHDQVMIPKAGHEKYFDSDNAPSWLFLPVMDIDEAAGFDCEESYPVIPLSGLLDSFNRVSEGDGEGDEYRKKNFEFRRAESRRELYAGIDFRTQENQREATVPELKKAIEFLTVCVKALADVATGLPTDKGNKEPILPIELDRKTGKQLSEDKKNMVNATRTSLLKDGCVWIPDFLDDVNLEDLKVLVVDLKLGAPLPDPMLLGIKSAMNWMAQNFQKPLPACPKQTISDSENDSLDSSEDEEGSSDANGSRSASYSPTTPPTIPEAVFLPTVAVVTPPRESGSDSDRESDLESDFVRVLNYS